MALEFTTRVADPIHGSIELTNIERRVISTRAFLRLRNVKQLGLAHYIFPNADYSRFSHSLGVCHIAGRMLGAIQRQHPALLTDEVVQQYRLAGLCHDIGHYPFSHAMEDAVKRHYAGGLFEEGPAVGGGPAVAVDHEVAGKRVLTADAGLLGIAAADYWLGVAQIFNRENPQHQFANVISSDLDADRIDYLMRTSHHTGLPYGHVDIEYLLSQTTLDNEGRVCFAAKAMRAAEHLLVSRYFDYQQVSYNKTVVGLEWVLKEVLGELLVAGLVQCSEADVTSMIADGEQWYGFDDGHVLQQIRILAGQANLTPEVLRFCEAVLHRTPPKLVGEIEAIGPRTVEAQQAFNLKEAVVRNSVPGWADQFGVPERRWHVWSRARDMTKMGASVPVTAAVDAERLEQALRIHEASGGGSTPIMNIRRSLMSVLADQTLYALRVYVLLPPDHQPAQRAAIRAQVQANGLLGWV